MKTVHVGIFVRSLESGKLHLNTMIPNLVWSGVTDDHALKVSVQFASAADGLTYELVAPNGPDNPVENSLSKRVNILNHIAFKADDFDSTNQYLIEDCSAIPVSPPMPAAAFGGKRVRFYLNKLGFITELIEA